MSPLDPEDQFVLRLDREALAMREQGTDLSKPGVAKAMLSIIPEDSRRAFGMMVEPARMEPSVERPEWAAMTRDKRGKVLVTAMTSMPEEFWEDD